MDENRLEGTARNVGGKVQEGVSRAAGDVKTKTEGVMNQAAGAAQDLYGQTADVARQTATTLDDWLRNTVETRPYTSAIVALGIGWLLGRMRPRSSIGRLANHLLARPYAAPDDCGSPCGAKRNYLN
jgi:uncharacterized protein YjbJ (UPF0337 family)